MATGSSDVEVAVIGGGPTGLLAALLMADAGVATALFAPPVALDPRTTALMEGALRVLGRVGLWPLLAPASGALRRLRIVDGSRRLLRAPEVLFSAREVGLDAFGHNFENTPLLAALLGEAERMPNLAIHGARVSAVEPDAHRVTVRYGDGRQLTARLVVGADGARSLCREAAGIAVRRWRYPQAALTLNVRHSRPHEDTSTEFHTEQGPFTLVPLPGQRASIVAVMRPGEARRLHALDDEALGRELARRAHGILGAMAPEAARGLRPLGGQAVARFAARRIALVGEAAHVVPPIGAQGLNLGIRDAAALADLVTTARQRGRDPGASDLLAAYHHGRAADVRPLTLAVDALNRSLLTDLLPLQAGRGAALWLMRGAPPLRRALMRRALRIPAA
jgi:2-octaprenyl-6-methoxyphenol hydroxylase